MKKGKKEGRREQWRQVGGSNDEYEYLEAEVTDHLLLSHTACPLEVCSCGKIGCILGEILTEWAGLGIVLFWGGGT